MSGKINFLMYQADQKNWFHPKSFVPQSCPSTAKFKHRREVVLNKDKKRVKYYKVEPVVTRVFHQKEESPPKASQSLTKERRIL